MTDSVAISLGAAAIGAMATITAAYLSYAKERQNERARILQDLDIAQKLPDESRAKEILQSYIDNRAVLLPLERQLRGYALGTLAAATVLVIGLAAPDSIHFHKASIEAYWLLAMTTLFLPISIYGWLYRYLRTKLINRFVSELGLPSEVAEPIGDRLAKNIVTLRFWQRGNR